jgi:hypothetical protein
VQKLSSQDLLIPMNDRYAQQLFQVLAGNVYDSCKSPKEWIAKWLGKGHSQATKLQDIFEGGLRSLTEGELNRKKVLAIIAALDSYHWMMKGFYADPTQFLGDSSQLPCAVENLVDSIMMRQDEMPVTGLSLVDQTALRVEETNFLFNLFRLVAKGRQSYPPNSEQRANLDKLMPSQAYKLLLLCLIAPSEVGLDPSNVVLRQEIPKLLPEMLREMGNSSSKAIGDLQRAIGNLQRERRDLSLAQWDGESLLRQPSSANIRFLEGYLLLCDNRLINEKDFEVGPKLLKRLVEIGPGRISPAARDVASLQLRLALRLHRGCRPKEVSEKIFGGLHQFGASWSLQREWQFYNSFPSEFDQFLVEAEQLNQAVFDHLGRRHHCGRILKSILKTANTVDDLTFKKKVLGAIVDRGADTIEKLSSEFDSDDQSVKKGIEIREQARLLSGILLEILPMVCEYGSEVPSQDLGLALSKAVQKLQRGLESERFRTGGASLLTKFCRTLPHFLLLPENVLGKEEKKKIVNCFSTAFSQFIDPDAINVEESSSKALFESLLTIIEQSHSPLVLRLIRDQLSAEGAQAVIFMIRPVLDTFVHNLSTEDTRALLEKVLDDYLLKCKRSNSDRCNPVTLRRQRFVVRELCRLLTRKLGWADVLEVIHCRADELLALLDVKNTDHVMVHTNAKICVMLVLQAVYSVANYENESERTSLNELAGKWTSRQPLTRTLLKEISAQLQQMEKLNQVRDSLHSELFRVYRCLLLSTSAILVARTQKKSNIFTSVSRWPVCHPETNFAHLTSLLHHVLTSDEPANNRFQVAKQCQLHLQSCMVETETWGLDKETPFHEQVFFQDQNLPCQVELILKGVLNETHFATAFLTDQFFLRTCNQKAADAHGVTVANVTEHCSTDLHSEQCKQDARNRHCSVRNSRSK